jgi:sulfate adenylyltransferase (ADP) / ATP adenylyltransferase
MSSIADLDPSPIDVLLPPGSLWPKVLSQTQHGLACGALQSIPTEYEWVPDAGANFLVRIVTNLVRKQAAKQQQKQRSKELGVDFNPFLPYESDLFVADLTPTHLALLNKFNVVDYHLLIVTRAFEHQDTLLTAADFAALWLCLQEYPGLGFYNGGTVAGASQRHKHLQIVPIPLVPDAPIPPLPISPLLEAVHWRDGFGQIPAWPFLHGLAKLDSEWPPEVAAQVLQQRYLSLLVELGNRILQPPIPDLSPQPGVLAPYSYNLLATRDWLMVVPRAQEKTLGISINSLGFAGALLVKNNEQLAELKQLQPLTVLGQVAIPKK